MKFLHSFIKKFRKQSKTIDIKILLNKKEKVLNLFAQAYKGKDNNKISYFQGQVELMEEIVNELKNG